MFNYWGSATPLSIRVIPFYIPTRVWFQFLRLLTNTYYFLCPYSLDTRFVQYLLGARPVLGVGDGEGLRLRMLWRGQGAHAGNSGSR